MRITRRVIETIKREAESAVPAECCGLLSGSDGVITDIYPLRNEAANPIARYFACPEDLFRAMRRIRESGQRMIGIYHSHPRTPPYPSTADIEMAFYPEALYFIISLEPQIELRAFRIKGSSIDPVPLAEVDQA